MVNDTTTAVDDLAAWLTQICDELEDAAGAAYYEGQVWLPEEESVITAPDWDVVYTADRKVDVEHIVEWQPSVVLARIAADRGLLAEALKYQPGQPGYGMARQAMKFLAAGHADRPGYREEWRP